MENPIQDILNLPPLRDVIKHFDLNPKKSLGQNFLLDLNITQKIARAAGNLKNCTVIEVGPGPGGLTRALLIEGAGTLISLEKDDKCFTALSPLVDAAKGRFRILSQDALTFDYQSIEGPKKIVANLPYNISTELLMGWLDQPDNIIGMTLMFQKEVAQRLVAAPDTKACGRLSLLTKARFDAEIAFILPPQVFTPAPKIDSAVVTFSPTNAPLSKDQWETLKLITRVAFAQRRKTLHNQFKAFGPLGTTMLETCGINPQRRAETLSLEEFLSLGDVYMSLK